MPIKITLLLCPDIFAAVIVSPGFAYIVIGW